MRPISIKEVAQTVSKIFGGIPVEFKEVRAGDFVGRKASNERALRELKWKPKVDLEEGVRRYVDWYKSVNK
jgi:nucleoside-diphosphate-sugar epimerase